MESKFLHKKRKTDVEIEMKSEVKKLKAQVGELQQQLHAARDTDAQTKRRCQQLVGPTAVA